MTDKDTGGNVVDLARARSARGGGKAREARKERARADKAARAAANRVRTGRTKQQKLNDAHEAGRHTKRLDDAHLDPDSRQDD